MLIYSGVVYPGFGIGGMFRAEIHWGDVSSIWGMWGADMYWGGVAIRVSQDASPSNRRISGDS